MILDQQLVLSDSQAITATALSANSIDLTNIRDLGIESDAILSIMVRTAFTGGGTVQFSYITSANADLSSATIVTQTPAIGTAQLTQGSEWLRIKLPALSKLADMKRYLGVSYTATGTVSGSVFAGIVLNREAIVSYPGGMNTGGF